MCEINWTYLVSVRDQSWENTKDVMKLQLHTRHSKSFTLHCNSVRAVIED
jgi:hypothetical protein